MTRKGAGPTPPPRSCDIIMRLRSLRAAFLRSPAPMIGAEAANGYRGLSLSRNIVYRTTMQTLVFGDLITRVVHDLLSRI